jgi:hypothetical protein
VPRVRNDVPIRAWRTANSPEIGRNFLEGARRAGFTQLASCAAGWCVLPVRVGSRSSHAARAAAVSLGVAGYLARAVPRIRSRRTVL